MWQINLIRLYCAVCDNSNTIETVTQRQSNNFCPIILAKGPRSGHAKVARELCEKTIIPLKKSGIMA